jgi:hypothetical protein
MWRPLPSKVTFLFRLTLYYFTHFIFIVFILFRFVSLILIVLSVLTFYPPLSFPLYLISCIIFFHFITLFYFNFMYCTFRYFAFAFYLLPCLQVCPFLCHTSPIATSLAPFCHKCSPFHTRVIHFILRCSHLFAPTPSPYPPFTISQAIYFPRGLPCTRKMEAAGSSETLVHGVISQKIVIFVSELVLNPKR